MKTKVQHGRPGTVEQQESAIRQEWDNSRTHVIVIIQVQPLQQRLQYQSEGRRQYKASSHFYSVAKCHFISFCPYASVFI